MIFTFSTFIIRDNRKKVKHILKKVPFLKRWHIRCKKREKVSLYQSIALSSGQKQGGAGTRTVRQEILKVLAIAVFKKRLCFFVASVHGIGTSANGVLTLSEVGDEVFAYDVSEYLRTALDCIRVGGVWQQRRVQKDKNKKPYPDCSDKVSCGGQRWIRTTEVGDVRFTV